MHGPHDAKPGSRRRFLRLAIAAGLGFSVSPLLGETSDALTYRVKRGDTLSEIARLFNVSVRDLKRANDLDSDLILVGQTLIIPRSASPSELEPVVEATRPLTIDRKRWKYIVAHHSAIERGNATSYGNTHKRRGMVNGLAYHFVIGNGVDSGDGEIEIGPRWRNQIRGGHVSDSSVNEAGVGICLVGNLENHPMTAKQRRSFLLLVDYLREHCVAPDFTFTVHRWVDGRKHTLCPGKHFPYREMSARYVR